MIGTGHQDGKGVSSGITSNSVSTAGRDLRVIGVLPSIAQASAGWRSIANAINRIHAATVNGADAPFMRSGETPSMIQELASRKRIALERTREGKVCFSMKPSQMNTDQLREQLNKLREKRIELEELAYELEGREFNDVLVELSRVGRWITLTGQELRRRGWK